MLTYLQNNWLEIFGVITGLLYLFFEIKQLSVMWVVGFITSLIYVFVFYQSKFYADMVLNIYYVFVSIYGFMLWQFRKSNTKEEKSNHHHTYLNLNKLLAIKLLVITVLLFCVMSYILKHFTDSPVPYGDALATSLSIVATWMLAKKIIQHWFVWMFVNTFSIVLFAYRELYPTSFLFLFYASLSYIGYQKWKKLPQSNVVQLSKI